MDIQIIFTVGTLTILPYLFLNTLISKEVLQWEPSKGKRILLMLVIWLVPFLGAVIAYKDLDLGWFKKRKSKKSNIEQGVASGLLELDAIFNPGQRHVIEARKKEEVRVEVSEDGQLYNNDPTSLINMQKNQTSESSENTHKINLALLPNMNRTELFLKREKAAKRKRFALQIVIALFVVIIGFLSIPSNSIELVKHNHSCTQTECTYLVTVKNIDHFSQSAYLRINAFIEISRGYTTSTEIVASERIEFEISAGEEKLIHGKFAVPTKPRILNFSAGQMVEDKPAY